jgi:hypothetical protein
LNAGGNQALRLKPSELAAFSKALGQQPAPASSTRETASCAAPKFAARRAVERLPPRSLSCRALKAEKTPKTNPQQRQSP